MLFNAVILSLSKVVSFPNEATSSPKKETLKATFVQFVRHLQEEIQTKREK